MDLPVLLGIPCDRVLAPFVSRPGLTGKIGVVLGLTRPLGLTARVDCGAVQVLVCTCGECGRARVRLPSSAEVSALVLDMTCKLY